MTRSPDSLTHITSRSRWTEEEARTVLDALDVSGLSVAAFAAQHAIQAQRVYLWRRKLASSSPSVPAAFVEVAPRALHAASAPARYELVTVHGESLRIEGAIDAAPTWGATGRESGRGGRVLPRAWRVREHGATGATNGWS